MSQSRNLRKPRDLETDRMLATAEVPREKIPYAPQAPAPRDKATAAPHEEIPYAPGAPGSDKLAEPEAFKQGGVVRKTGLAKVHKGERILPATRAAQLLGKSGRKSARKRGTRGSRLASLRRARTRRK